MEFKIIRYLLLCNVNIFMSHISKISELTFNKQ